MKYVKCWLPLPLLILLTSCSACQWYGVAVPKDSKVTGTVVEEHRGSIEEVMARCQSPFEIRYGCTIAKGDHEYVIWYTDSYAKRHELCHAQYEIFKH